MRFTMLKSIVNGGTGDQMQLSLQLLKLRVVGTEGTTSNNYDYGLMESHQNTQLHIVGTDVNIPLTPLHHSKQKR